jgi:glucuronate isomerase
MMKKFLDENFLLQTKTAEYLYHEHASRMPVIDYHCHLSPAVMAENKSFDNLTQAWLLGDHYKWRAMRANGISEYYCTGNAPDWDKFEKWAETVPYTLRNPLFHWTHLELQRYFGIRELLGPDSARDIYNSATSQLREANFKPMVLLQKMQVEIVCTTDDPVDDLKYHRSISDSGFPVRVIPAWRPDKVLAVEDPRKFGEYVNALARIADIEINSYNRLLEALEKRHNYFHTMGCRLSDHGLETFYAEEYHARDIERQFSNLIRGKQLTLHEINQFRSAMLYDLALMDNQKGWTQQFHIGAQRNNNTRMLAELGPDTGFDSIGDLPLARCMAHFLNRLASGGNLAKTILYNLNPADNEVMATMTGNFQDGSFPGKIQWGSGWWFLDQKDGMEKQLNALSNHGLLSRFVGMLTDSRSFLSFPRHEYFRRILCNLLGNDAERGEIPGDKALLAKMVEDICYYNAKNYFKF